MTKYIYRQGSDIYDARSQQKLTPAQFGNGSGYQELKPIDGAKFNTKETQQANFDTITPIGNTLYGIAKTTPATQAPAIVPPTGSTPAVGTTLDATTINNGLKTGNIGGTLPDANAATLAYQTLADNAVADASKGQVNYQSEIDKLKAQQLKDVETQKAADQAQIDKYNADNQPIADATTLNLKNQAGALNKMFTQDEYSNILNQQKELTDNIVGYGNLMKTELVNSSNNFGLATTKQLQENDIKLHYTSLITTSQAALQAVSNRFNLANDTLNAGAVTINNQIANKANFLNTIKTMDGLLNDKEKAAVDTAISDLQAKQKVVDTNKATIQNLMSDPATASVAVKAGLVLTDSPDVIAQKLSQFYAKNPGYAPENIANNKAIITKYPDAGILATDTAEIVKAKLANSAIYKKDTIENGKFASYIDPATGEKWSFNNLTGQWTKEVSDTSVSVKPDGSVGRQCGSYIQSIMTNAPLVGDTTESKKKAMNMSSSEFSKNPQVGDIIAFNIGKYGHVAVVTGVNDDQLTVNESNYHLDEKVGTRTISSNTPSIIGAYRGASFKNTVNNDNIDKVALDYIKNGSKVSEIKGKDQAETAAIIKSYLRQKADGGQISKTDAETTSKLQDKLTQLDDLIKKTDNSGAVGPNFLARTSLTSWATGARQAFAGSIKQLISQETINTLLNLKKAGGTLGALSDQERIMLQSAATKIGAWEMKDKSGNGTGFYNVSEKDFKAELENIKKITKKAIENAGGQSGIINNLEQNLSTHPEKIDEYNTLVKSNPNLSEDEINQLLGF